MTKAKLLHAMICIGLTSLICSCVSSTTSDLPDKLIGEWAFTEYVEAIEPFGSDILTFNRDGILIAENPNTHTQRVFTYKFLDDDTIEVTDGDSLVGTMDITISDDRLAYSLKKPGDSIFIRWQSQPMARVSNRAEAAELQEKSFSIRLREVLAVIIFTSFLLYYWTKRRY